VSFELQLHLLPARAQWPSAIPAAACVSSFRR